MDDSLTAVLEHEHHEIDAGIEAFLEGLAQDERRDQELTRAVGALRRHIYLEEEFLFPPPRAFGMIPPVLLMLREHVEIWRTLDAVEATDHQSDAAGGWQRCHGSARPARHPQRQEEPVIYPQGDAVLTDEAKRDLRAFIDSGADAAGMGMQPGLAPPTRVP